jgi:DNA-directed RNA polymerase subunit M/transcription elongation factor TFIIS
MKCLKCGNVLHPIPEVAIKHIQAEICIVCGHVMKRKKRSTQKREVKHAADVQRSDS